MTAPGIKLEDILDAIKDVDCRLAGMDKRLSNVELQLGGDKFFNGVFQILEKHESRLDKFDELKWKAAGAGVTALAMWEIFKDKFLAIVK